MAKIVMKCPDCGSANVGKDSWASWDVGRQEWVHGDVYDHGFCNDCGQDQRGFNEEEVPNG